MKANNDFREFAERNKVALWEIAVRLGVCENTFYRRLRTELSEEEKTMLRQVVCRIVDERKIA